MAEISTSPTNADTPATQSNGNGDAGTDAPTITINQTQATNPQTVDFGDYNWAPTSSGVGANDDNPDPLGVAPPKSNINDGSYDAAETARFARQASGLSNINATLGNSDSNAVTGSFNTNGRPQIIPQANVLDKFSSYTYRISVYLMSPTQYAQLARSHKKNINGYNLLFQSGGAPTNTGGFQGGSKQADLESEGIGFVPTSNVPQSGAPDAGRNPAFPLDFYIDSCSITNLLQGKGTGSSHSVATMKFTVIEPVGITLIDRIYQAVQDAAPTEFSGKVNYQNAQYLMVIRWYGYDQNGNIVGGNAANSDAKAAVEKFIPFVINKINWRVTPKATEYEFDCTPIGQIIAGGTRRGVVPYDMQLSEGTVGKILAGELTFAASKQPKTQQPGAATAAIETESAISPETGETYQKIKAPSNASAAATPKLTVKQGLMAAMNEFSNKLTVGKDAVYEIADQYEIVFANGAEAIRDATIVVPNTKKNARGTPMGVPSTTNANGLNPDTQSKDTSVASKFIFAGQSIVQVIDQVIRNSSYILNQALTVYDNNQEKTNDNSKQKKKPVDWYRINFEAVPIGDKSDTRRNDYAYKIRYIISAYRIDNYDSKYFPVGSFRGVHKSYPWIFTGKNIAVLDYSETLNSAYNMLVSGSDPGNSAAEIERRKVAATMRELVTYTYGPASGETRQGINGKEFEPAANLADSLYGAADLANTKLTIIGDPAWIQQGSIAGGIQAELFTDSSFLPDGTINFDAEQINFEVTWNRPADYNVSTGLADPNSINKPPISRVYTASKVTSDFKQGTFTTTIDGLLFFLPKPDGSNKALSAPMPNQTDAETLRLARSGSRDLANITEAVAQRTGLSLTTAAAKAARDAFGAIDPRRVDKPAAGVGATAAVPNPVAPLPTSTAKQISNNIPQRLKDAVRSAPPPANPTLSSGTDIKVNIQAPQKISTNPATDELTYLAEAVVNNEQIISWDP